MHVYVIQYDDVYFGSKISQEGYSSLKAAQKFIEGRSGNHTKVNEYRYESETYSYTIVDVQIKEDIGNA